MKHLSFYANGKLLLSGEYFVLDGAKAIGLPCKLGQSLEVSPYDSSGLVYWNSFDSDGTIWFNGVFQKSDLSIIETSDQKTSTILQNILRQAKKLNPSFLNTDASLMVETRLSFPRLWGLGTSSTLIYNLAQWSEVDPFQLSSLTLGGSGYDIACAGAMHPILYQIKDDMPTFEKIDFYPAFKEHLYFVYLSKKQDSREGIKQYRAKAKNNATSLHKISSLTEAFLNAKSFHVFQKLMLEHEELVSQTIDMEKVQDLYFPDFDGVVKSLGAWGGDFVLVASEQAPEKIKTYFNKKGFETFLRYEEMIS